MLVLENAHIKHNTKAVKHIDMLRALKYKLNRSVLEKIFCLHTAKLRIWLCCVG